MTNNPLMDQCRKEAEERYTKATQKPFDLKDILAVFWVSGCCAALYHERSKPKREGLSDEALIALLRRCSDDALLRIERRVYPDKGTMDLLVEDFALGLRTAHYAPSGTLTVEQAIEAMALHYFNYHQQAIGHKGSKLYDALREALTAKAR